MSILVINSGSTSTKYKLFAGEREIKSGNIVSNNHRNKIIKEILREIGDLRDIKAVGHRVVHGGDLFRNPIILNSKLINDLEKYNSLAPLHNPYNLAGINAATEYLPQIPQIAVFDTGFYRNLPEVARTYAIPVKIAEKYKMYRYGFHGISHEFVMQEATKQLKLKESEINLISCHLGGGWSITAIKRGQPVDTSMGWTPLEGLVMLTRAGDLDPGIVIELIRKTIEETDRSLLIDHSLSFIQNIYNLLNHESGIKGLTNGLTDFQELLRNVSLGDEQAKLAFAIAVNRLIKYIGSYFVILEGKVDAIIFTGAIGAGNPYTRNQVIKKIRCLGDLKYLIIKTNEELAIARKVESLLGGGLRI